MFGVDKKLIKRFKKEAVAKPVKTKEKLPDYNFGVSKEDLVKYKK